MGRFDGKVALITGSTLGIGLAIAERLGSEGAKIIISSRKQKAVDEVVTELRKKKIECEGKAANAGKNSDIKDLVDFTVKKYGQIDYVIPNAASNPQFGNFLEAEEWHWDKIFETNVKGPFFLVKYAKPYMTKKF